MGEFSIGNELDKIFETLKGSIIGIEIENTCKVVRMPFFKGKVLHENQFAIIRRGADRYQKAH